MLGSLRTAPKEMSNLLEDELLPVLGLVVEEVAFKVAVGVLDGLIQPVIPVMVGNQRVQRDRHNRRAGQSPRVAFVVRRSVGEPNLLKNPIRSRCDLDGVEFPIPSKTNGQA